MKTKTVDAKLLGTEKHLSSSKQKLKSMSTQFKLTELNNDQIAVEINGTAKPNLKINLKRN